MLKGHKIFICSEHIIQRFGGQFQVQLVAGKIDLV
jgi:hypothetical protein